MHHPLRLQPSERVADRQGASGNQLDLQLGARPTLAVVIAEKLQDDRLLDQPVVTAWNLLTLMLHGSQHLLCRPRAVATAPGHF